jgi:hypothetical protein
VLQEFVSKQIQIIKLSGLSDIFYAKSDVLAYFRVCKSKQENCYEKNKLVARRISSDPLRHVCAGKLQSFQA